MIKNLTSDAFFWILPDFTLAQDKLDKVERRGLMTEILARLANQIINSTKSHSAYLGSIAFMAVNFAILFDQEVASKYGLKREILLNEKEDEPFFKYLGIQRDYAELIKANATEAYQIKEISIEQFNFLIGLADLCIFELEN